MLKIVTVCGMGLGSSLLIEMNAKKVVSEMGLDAELSHLNIASFSDENWDYVIVGKDLANTLKVDPKKLIVVINIASLDELRIAMKKVIKI